MDLLLIWCLESSFTHVLSDLRVTVAGPISLNTTVLTTPPYQSYGF